jgi:ribosomal protein S18 acetylase RimI-like enzyme
MIMALGREQQALPTPTDLIVTDLRTLPKAKALDLLQHISSLERKVFPQNEAFGFQNDLLSKQNTFILVICDKVQEWPLILGYAVYVRWQGSLLLHKLCVNPKYRGRGIGKFLMADIIVRARRSSCQLIELWVDESREVARGLYRRFEFQEADRKENYYAQGRHGIKMFLKLSE